MTEGIKNDTWEYWYENLAGKLLLYARQHIASIQEAEDVVHDAFVRIWKNRHELGDLQPFHFYRTVRWISIDRIRESVSRDSREELWAEDTLPSCFTPEDSSLGEEVSLALARLPETQREVLVLKLWGEQTFEEIGELLGISPNTAASRYRYALRKLKEILATPKTHE